MRAFQNKNWEYSIRQFDLLSQKKEWSIRFRMNYMHEISREHSTYWRFRIFISNLLGILNLTRFSLAKQWNPIRIRNHQVIIPFADSTGYLLHLQPVARELVRQGKDILLLCSTREYFVLKNKLGPDLSAHLFPYESLSDRQTYIGRVFHILFSLVFAVANILWFSVQPVRYSLQNSAMFGRFAFTQFFLAGFLRRSINETHVIVSTSDHWLWESLFFTIARKQGIRTYSLQHGTVEDMAYPMFTRYFVCWGQQDYRKMTEKFGASPGEILISGSPYFDKLYAEVKMKTAGTNAFGNPCITYLSQPLVIDGYLTEEEYRAALSRFYALQPLAQSHGKNLQIKLHPRGKEHTYDDKPAEVSITQEPLYEVLRQSAVTVTYDSTAIFESTMFSVPCVQSILPESPRQMIYADTGICLLSHDEKELYEWVKKLLEDRNFYNSVVQNASASLSGYFGSLTGSLDRIINQLEGRINRV